MSHIAINVGSETRDSYLASVTLGPWRNFTLTLADRFGEKRFPVDGWGALVANTPDVYRGGWKTSVAWSRGNLSAYALYGSDKLSVFQAAAATDYSASVLVGGLSWRFTGWQ